MKKFVYLLLGLVFWSCNSENQGLTVSTGRLGEVYVIVEQDLLKPEFKRALSRTFETPQLLFGGEEPHFKLIFMTPAQAKGSLIFEGTIVAITKGGEDAELLGIFPEGRDSLVKHHQKSKVRSLVFKDLWSTPQQMLCIIAETPESAVDYLTANSITLLSTLLNMERREAVGRMTKVSDAKITREIAEKHGIEVKAPIAYHIASNSKISETEGFIWLRNDGSEVDLNVVIHYQPYTDTSQFQLLSLIARRDSVVKPYITGEAQGSYMATDTQFPYYAETIEFNGMYAREYNALWTLENDFMGGPYYSVTVLDETKNRLITLEGFVFAPNKEKTRYLRELQGILYGVKF